MQVDLSQDYLVWDNTEAVTHIRKRVNGGGDVLTPISIAKNRQLTFKERAASGGVYTSMDRAFLVPKALLSSAKPGDQLIDSQAITYTVLEAPDYANETRWKLICRDLILAADLRDSIDIQRAAVSYDSMGGKITTWPPSGGTTPYASVPARVQKIEDTNELIFGATGYKGDYAVMIGQEVVLGDNDRMKFGTSVFEIIAYRNSTRIDELPVLDCRLMP